MKCSDVLKTWRLRKKNNLSEGMSYPLELHTRQGSIGKLMTGEFGHSTACNVFWTARSKLGSCCVGRACAAVVVSVCPAMNRSTNNTTYSASGIGRSVCRIFSDTTAFESYGVKTK